MSKGKKISYIEYFKTSMITLIVLVFIATVVLICTRYNVQHQLSDDDLALQDDMVGYLLSKYKYQEEVDKNNATVNLKLGQLYELLGSYKQAEQEYILALEKRNGNYDAASFGLAGVYLFEKKYDQAETLISSLKDVSKYSAILGKGKFFKSYGDALFNEGMYLKAMEQYDRAYFYLEKINNSLIKDVELARCDSSVALADKFVAENKVPQAIEFLKESEDRCKNSLVTYKLGILYFDTNPEKAVDLFEEVQKKDPSIINYQLYKRLLFSLKTQFMYAGNVLKSELYDAKLTRLRSYMQRNVLQAEELLFSDFDFAVKKFPIRNEYDVIYKFSIENITNHNIPKLFAIVEFYDKKGTKLYEYTQKITKGVEGLKAASGKIETKIVIKTKKNIIQQFDEITIRMYLTKNAKVSKLLYSNNKLDVTKGKKSE